VTNRVEVNSREGKVVLNFHDDEGMRWYALEPDIAAQIAEAIARENFTARFGVDTVPKGRSAVAAQMRETLVTRVSHIIRSLTEQHKPRAYIASCVVDEVMGRVL
jgi:hypothetical protein